MRAIIEDEMADDGVKLRVRSKMFYLKIFNISNDQYYSYYNYFEQSYCTKHSRTNTKDKVGVGGGAGTSSTKGGSDSEDGESRKRKRKEMTVEEKNQARAAK